MNLEKALTCRTKEQLYMQKSFEIERLKSISRGENPRRFQNTDSLNYLMQNFGISKEELIDATLPSTIKIVVNGTARNFNLYWFHNTNSGGEINVQYFVNTVIDENQLLDRITSVDLETTKNRREFLFGKKIAKANKNDESSEFGFNLSDWDF